MSSTTALTSKQACLVWSVGNSQPEDMAAMSLSGTDDPSRLD